jgi:hypothetical protein
VIITTPTLAAAALLGFYDKNFSVDSVSEYTELLQWNPKFALYVAEAKKDVWGDISGDITWVYLDREVQTYLVKKTTDKGMGLNQLVNELLKNAIKIIKTVDRKLL